jgi:hypothetical protein
MRLMFATLVLLAAAPVLAAGSRPLAPASGAALVRFHPVAWQLPAGALQSALRFDPDGADAAPALRSLRADEAGLRAAAEAAVRIDRDGSRHAVVGAAMRSWTVLSIDENGRAVTDCVQGSHAAAARAVEAPAAGEVRR